MDVHMYNTPQTEASGDSDDDVDWEEVMSPSNVDLRSSGVGQSTEFNVEGTSSTKVSSKPIEITLESGRKRATEKRVKNSSNADRAIRIMCHKMHTVALLANALNRNKWLNDPLLRARLMSIIPLSIQNSFTMISKKNQPDAAKRGRLFEASLMRLTQWWYETFETTDTGHIRSRTYNQIQRILEDDVMDEESGEVIRSSKSLMKHVLMRKGCRDTNAQLFTALCRSLDIPARLVVSLQGVPWQAQVNKKNSKLPSKSKKGKEKAVDISESTEEDISEEEDDMEEVDIPDTSSGKEIIIPGDGQTLSGNVFLSDKDKKARPILKLRKSRPRGQRLDSKSSVRRRQSSAPPLGGYPPVFWTEVFSRPDGRWLPVDPVRYIVNKRRVFEPPPHDKDNRMVYVIAIEEDGYARDVTPRYAKEYGAKTSKIQMGGKGRQDWWAFVMALMTRPFRLHRDDVEDEEFEINQVIEGMPVSISGFKNHPLYVLERHLRRDEVIHPKIEMGKFRGEPVYPRSNVVPLKTAENWMRVGRKIKEGCQAMKMVKQRAVTIHRRRVIEMAQQGGEEILQGLYSEAQTELYIPEPVIDGRIPKNDFGNIDLYVHTMLPPGSAHVYHKRAAKIARELEFDYAEAVTGFEFRKGRAFPILTGVVVALENEITLQDACLQHERNAEEKKQAKRIDKMLKKWSRLIQGLRIRQRLQEQYSDGRRITVDNARSESYTDDTNLPGGFLTEADAVVEPFHLPKLQHSAYVPLDIAGTAQEISELKEKLEDSSKSMVNTEIIDADDMEVRIPVPDNDNGIAQNVVTPMTMRELAEIAQRKEINNNTLEDSIMTARVQSPGENASRYSSVSRTTDAARLSKTSKRPPKKRPRRTSAPVSSSDNDVESSPIKKVPKANITQPASTRVLRPRKPKTANKIEIDSEGAN